MSTTVNVRIISPEGPMRMGESVEKLRTDFDELLATGVNHIIINLSKVTALDSTGIGYLVRALNFSRQKGGVVKLVGLPAQVRNTLTVTGLLKLFEVFDDNAAALASFADKK